MGGDKYPVLSVCSKKANTPHQFQILSEYERAFEMVNSFIPNDMNKDGVIELSEHQDLPDVTSASINNT